MKTRTRHIIGLSVLASAFATLITCVVLLAKKKNAWKAFLAITAIEGVVGIALLYDEILPRLPIKKKKKAEKAEGEEAEELFDEEDVDQARSAIDAELAHTGDDDAANADAGIDNEIPRDDEASEEDFL